MKGDHDFSAGMAAGALVVFLFVITVLNIRECGEPLASSVTRCDAICIERKHSAGVVEQMKCVCLDKVIQEDVEVIK